jgi:hypothetical protein
MKVDSKRERLTDIISNDSVIGKLFALTLENCRVLGFDALYT